MRKVERISISTTDREQLERLVRGRNTPQKVVWRDRIVLLASDGSTAEAIAAAVGKSLLTVRRWRRRYMAKGTDGLLKDATRPSRVKPLSPETIKQVVHMTLHEKPPNATQWSGRSMAAAAGISLAPCPSGTPASSQCAAVSARYRRGWHRRSLGSAARALRAETGAEYLSLKLDDPSFTAPVYASLVQGDKGDHKLIWSR
jgi:uncharacterized protein (DUF736 family)